MPTASIIVCSLNAAFIVARPIHPSVRRANATHESGPADYNRGMSSEAARRRARNVEGPRYSGDPYWDVDENSAGLVYPSRHGDYWRRAIQQESPVGALEQVEKRHTWLHAQLSMHANQLTGQLAEGGTPELRTQLDERARYLVDLFAQDDAWQLPEQLVDLLTSQRPERDAELLAELRAGRHAELLAKLSVEDLTQLLTEYHAGLLTRAQQRAERQSELFRNIDAVAKNRDPPTRPREA